MIAAAFTATAVVRPSAELATALFQPEPADQAQPAERDREISAVQLWAAEPGEALPRRAENSTTGQRFAQAAAPAPPASPAPAQSPAPTAARPSAANPSDSEVVFTLLRTTLVAVHHANVTGNYTVLRDLAAPGFRDRNSAADLAVIFTPIRSAKIDLSAVVLLDPQLSKAALNDQKMLHLTGSLATNPVPVNFELLFQPIDGAWRVFGISVIPVQQTGAPPTAPPTRAPPAAKATPKSNPAPAKSRPQPPASPSPQP